MSTSISPRGRDPDTRKAEPLQSLPPGTEAGHLLCPQATSSALFYRYGSRIAQQASYLTCLSGHPKTPFLGPLLPSLSLGDSRLQPVPNPELTVGQERGEDSDTQHAARGTG